MVFWLGLGAELCASHIDPGIEDEDSMLEVED